MTLRIHQNVASVFAQKHLGRASRRLHKNFERISSGERLNRAADGAAGLAISEKMRAHVKSFQVAMRNTQDGISLINTAEGAMSEVSGVLSRMRELAVQAASDVLQTQARDHLSAEFTELRSEIDRIANTNDFNGIKLTNGSVTFVDVQIGINNVGAEDRIQVNLADMNASALSVDTSTVTSALSAQTTITSLDAAIDNLNGQRASLGSFHNRLRSAVHNLQISYENLVGAESAIRDVDFASETAGMTRNNIFQQAGVAILTQANQSPSVAILLIQ